MKITLQNPVRHFEVGWFKHKTVMSDCGAITLAPEEIITFVTESGTEYDLARKSWGYYATPSLGDRLYNFKLRAVMTVNHLGKYSIQLVEKGCEDRFFKYLREEQMTVVTWLDSNGKLNKLQNLISSELPELTKE
jgi:hypothetical protein